MTESTIDRATRMAVRDRLKKILTGAQKSRDQRPNLVGTRDGGSEPEWARWERSVMTGAVNAERGKPGLPPISSIAVEEVERQAAGHIDYTDKFALYCSELAVGLKSVRP